MPPLEPRGQKAVDVAATYIEVLIGLASGIIAAVLGVSPDLIKIPGFDSPMLKIALIVFGSSIIAGLLSLGGLVAATGDENETYPPTSGKVTVPTFAQLALFGGGILLMISVIP